MDSLKIQRASCKAAITRIFNWLHSNLEESDKYDFKSQYFEIQNQIKNISVDSEQEFDDRSQLEVKYYSLHCKLQNAYEKLNSKS